MTIITFSQTEIKTPHPHVRKFDVRRDLSTVADLVEQAFHETLDADGRLYIQQLRRSAMHPQFLQWAAGMAERASFPFSGFVWEQDGKIVGNLSLIPLHRRGRRTYLIANVAVHAGYRRRGVAQALTETAVEACRRRRVDQVWLHVREDNPAAIALYRKQSFVERARRTTWHSRREAPEPFSAPGIRITRPTRRHWPQQLAWLNDHYPEKLAWYLPLKTRLLRPDLVGVVSRLFSGTALRQWSVVARGQLLGALSWQRTYSATDRLWLAAPDEMDELAVRMLLLAARQRLHSRKTLNLEFPAGQAAGVFEAAGFNPHHTLIWMQLGG